MITHFCEKNKYSIPALTKNTIEVIRMKTRAQVLDGILQTTQMGQL